MPRKSIVPWPVETHENYRLIIYKVERVTVSLLTLINEAAEHNYMPYEDKVFIANIRRRLTEAHDAALDMVYHAPGVKGKPPMWVTLTKKIIKLTDKMLDALDRIEADAPKHLYDTVIETTEVMIDACLELLDGFRKVPLDDDIDDNGSSDSNTLYLSYLFSTIEK